MQQECSSVDDVLQWIAQHEPVLTYGNFSVAGKKSITRDRWMSSVAVWIYQHLL